MRLATSGSRRGLKDEERLEYEQLERIVDATMEQTFTPQTDWDEKIAAVQSQLGGGLIRNDSQRLLSQDEPGSLLLPR
jgi:hypothetical protein